MAYLIRQLAVDAEGHIVAATEFEKIVHIWNIQSASELIVIKSNLDFGGERLAISSDGDFCAVGAYNRYGISLYSVSDGTLLWNRKDLKNVQYVDFNISDGNIIAGFDEKPLHILELMTGNTLETIRGVRAKWTSYFNDVYLLSKKEYLNLFRGNNKVASIERTTFAELSAVFSRDKVFVSESGGPVSAYLLNSGELAWRYYPDAGSHFLKLTYNDAIRKLYGILWPYKKGGPKVLYSIDASSGTVLNKLQLSEETTETILAKGGNCLITSTGDIYDLNEEIPRMIKTLSWDGINP